MVWLLGKAFWYIGRGFEWLSLSMIWNPVESAIVIYGSLLVGVVIYLTHHLGFVWR